MFRRIAALFMALALLVPACLAEEETAAPTELIPTETVTAEPVTDQAPELTEEPVFEPTAEPTAEPTTVPTAEPTAEPASMTTPHPESQAWFIDINGQLVCGDLFLIMPMAHEDTVIYIMADENILMWAMDMNEELTEKMEFVLDPEKYPYEDTHELHVTFEPPEGFVQPDELHEYIYIWVEKIPEPSVEPFETPVITEEPEVTAAPDATDEPVTTVEPDITAEPTCEPAVTLTVDAADYVPGAWSCLQPVFTLSGIPEDSGRYVYAAIVYDERFVILSGDTYTARDEGVYDIRFAILDGIGDVVAISDIYSVMLDYTAPAYLMVSMVGGSYTDYTVYTEDRLSGVAGYTNDGGLTWIAPGEDGSALFTGKSGDIIAAGNILAMDAAGNITPFAEDFMLPEKFSGGGGYYGGGGGGGSSGPVHAPVGEEVELNPYNALVMDILAEPMTILKVGETELPLELSFVEADDFIPEEDWLPTFTAEMTTWSTFDPGAAVEEETEATEDAAADVFDTLVLTVADEELMQGLVSYRFDFNGIAYRMLFNSGVDYLAFRIGDECVAFRTEGFTAGSEFTRLKAEGVSTKKFDYSLTLTADKAGEFPMEMAFSVSVEDNGELLTFELTDDETQDMYYYDLQLGGVDMMDVAFGAYEPVVEEGDVINE